MEKTTRIIEAAQAQTFGVEIEMNNITRHKAAEIAATFFGTNHYEDTSWKDGYMTWTAWDEQGRKWKFSRDCSIAGPDSERCELVTPVLGYKDMETLQELIRELRTAGAKSDATRGCGVHIHVGIKATDGTAHTPKTIKNLVNLMKSHEDLIKSVVKIDNFRIDRYCGMISEDFLERVNEYKPNELTWENLAIAWYGSKLAMDHNLPEHYSQTRYRMLNLHPTMQWMNGVTSERSHSKPTIEFRAFQFDAPKDGKKNGLHAGQLKAYIDFCLHMSAYAKLSNSVSAKKGQRDNGKYAMRTWLLRLGFIGEEFKNTRTHLMRNLEGNAAWRNA